MGKKTPAAVAVANAISLRQFPPLLTYPKPTPDALLSECFELPTITWVPECTTANRKPKCIVDGCPCVPKVKAYKQRIVEDVDHRTILYYARYQCSGSSRRSFSTLDDDFLSSSKTFILHFPYLLTYKTGVSEDVFDMLYDGMLSTKGIAGAVANIQRRRQKRYYQILARVGVAVEERRLYDGEYSPTLPPTETQYMSLHTCLDSEVLMELWLTHTDIYSRLCAAQMKTTRCDRVFRMDHSQKFCSMLKIHGADGSKEQSENTRLLLLIQNEVGQIMGRSLTRSENHDETEALLRGMHDNITSESEGPRICVCDNANGNRKLIEAIFGEAVVVKQDPFHVICRFTEKIRDPAKKKWLSVQLSAAIYDVQRDLRHPEEMEKQMKAVLQGIDPSFISVKPDVWEGCMASNLAQVLRGDLYVDQNQYCEEGGDVRVVSTSQVEGIHSKLRKLLDRVVSIEVGLRILDIFLLQHNLNVGAKHKRNPLFTATDFRAVCRSAIMWKETLPGFSQAEYMELLISKSWRSQHPAETYRPSAPDSTCHRPWESLCEMIDLRTERVESKLLQKRDPVADIRALTSRGHKSRKSLHHSSFADLLGLEPEYESTREFTSNEFSLLKELRREQLASKKPWSRSEVVATVLFNSAVMKLDNPDLGIKKRGFRAIARRLPAIDEQVIKRPSKLNSSRMFIAEDKPVDDENASPDEEALMKKLFSMVRGSSMKKKRKVYATVYNFAASVCSGIYPKTDSFLERRWDSLKRAHNRAKPSLAATIDTTDLTQNSESAGNQDKPPASTPVTSTVDRNTISSSTSSKVEGTAITVLGVTEESLRCTSLGGATVESETETANPVCSQQEEQAPNPVLSTPSDLYRLTGSDAHTIAYLKTVASTIPKGTRRKWAVLHAEYLRRHPGSTLTENGLRCKLRDRKRRKLEPPVAQVTSSTAAKSLSNQAEYVSMDLDSNKRPAPACDSCRTRKRKCGPTSSNTQCVYRKEQQHQPISSFFTNS